MSMQLRLAWLAGWAVLSTTSALCKLMGWSTHPTLCRI